MASSMKRLDLVWLLGSYRPSGSVPRTWYLQVVLLYYNSVDLKGSINQREVASKSRPADCVQRQLPSIEVLSHL